MPSPVNLLLPVSWRWLAEVGLAALVASLTLLVMHWLPWRMVFRGELPRPAAYILGVLALILPLSFLLIWWGDLQALAAVWIVVISGGMAVLEAYLADWLLAKIALAQELSELMKLRNEGEHGEEGAIDAGRDGPA